MKDLQVNEIQIQMEDSAGQVGVSLEFDFDFDDENLMTNPDAQMPSNHDPHEVQVEKAAENISTQENVELGNSSSGSNDHQPLIHQKDLKQNQLTPSTLTSSDLLNPPVLENIPADLAQPPPAFNPPLVETPQSFLNPTTEYKESESLYGYCQPQLNHGDPNWNYQQPGYDTSENQVPQAFTTPNLPQLGPSSLNDTSMAPLQPYPPTMMGLNGNDGAIQSLQPEYEANMIYPNQPMMNARSKNVPPNQHMPLPHNLGSHNEFTLNNQTILQSITGNNFSSIRQQPSLCPTLFPQNTIGVEVINQRQLPINQPRATLLPHNQLNAAYRLMTPLGSQPNEFLRPNVFDPQCLNFNMLPQAYALLRPQHSSNHLQQLNQVSQVPNLLDPQFQYSVLPRLSMPSSYSPQSFLYHQVSVPPNVYDPQGFSSMLSPELSISTRTPQLTNYQQQNQVWMAQNSLLPGSSTVTRLQEMYGRQQLNQLTHLTPNLHPQLGSSILLEMLSGSPQLVDHYQVSVPPYACNPQQHNSLGARPSVLPRPQRLHDHRHPLEQVQNSQFYGSVLSQAPNLSRPPQSSKHQQPNQVPEIANTGVDPQLENILSPQSSRPSSSQTKQTCGILKQAARQSVSCISPGTNSRQTQTLTSKAQQEIEGGSKMVFPDLCEASPSSLKEKEQLEGNKRTATEQHVVGEPSQSPKRSKKERSLPPPSSQEDQDGTSQSEGNHEVEKEGNEVQNSNPSTARRVKNTVYDPTYVGFGVPVDPHLRLFNPR